MLLRQLIQYLQLGDTACLQETHSQLIRKWGVSDFSPLLSIEALPQGSRVH